MQKADILKKISEGLVQNGKKYKVAPSQMALGITIGINEEEGTGRIDYFLIVDNEIKEKLDFNQLMQLNIVQSLFAQGMQKDLIVASHIGNFITTFAQNMVEITKEDIPNVAYLFKIKYYNFSEEDVAKNDIKIDNLEQMLGEKITDKEREILFDKLKRQKNTALQMKYNLRCFVYLKEDANLELGYKLKNEQLVNINNKAKEIYLTEILGE